MNQPEKVQRKIFSILDLICQIERPSDQYLKHIAGTDGLYEVRVQLGSNIYRIFCCFDEGKLVILFNGFQKKTQKTPRKELEKAERLKLKYFEAKKSK